jgi:hypothetical protein
MKEPRFAMWMTADTSHCRGSIPLHLHRPRLAGRQSRGNACVVMLVTHGAKVKTGGLRLL